MGYSLAWVAVRGIPHEAVLERQGLRSTGRRADFAESPISAWSPSNGWSLVIARGCDHRILKQGNLARLSMGCDVIACSIEEHVMFSSSEYWSNGTRQWRVGHDAQRALDHVLVQGQSPPDYAATLDRFSVQQTAEGGADAGVDHYFEIPLMLAHARVGFKHDEVDVTTDGQFEVLEDLAASSKPWWQRRR